MSALFDGLFVFEMANNHQGSLEHALRIVEAMGRLANRYGVRAALKLQYRDLDRFIHPHFRDRTDVPHVQRFLETRLSEADFRVIVAATKQAGLVTACTPFDEVSVDRIVDHGIEVVKVASCSADDWPLLERIARAGRPVIGSTGGRSIEEIDNLVSFLTHRGVDLALMHCVAVYPTPPDRVNLNFLERLRRRFPSIAVGYSGHEGPEELEVVRVAVAKGARILERHVGIRSDSIALNAYSMDPDQAEAWLAAALAAKRVTGSADKPVAEDEISSLRSLARGAYLRRSKRQGEPVTADDVYFAMPCAEGQTSSGEYLPTMVAGRDYRADEPLRERRGADTVIEVRRSIHEARGMLCEAGVVPGATSTIELSHHHGLEAFRQWGALIVSVVNREYCKKLVVMLPGQSHPVHHHRLKEETFHVLSGELQAIVNDVPRHLRAGDMLLIERGARHAFSSEGGCIFEEISTTHAPNDSYYEDERIARLDPIRRKTVLDGW